MTLEAMTPTRLMHFSEEPFTLDPSRTYEPGERDLKPRGFWLSDESDYGWREWATDEDFNTYRLAYRTEFHVKRGSNVLALTNDGDILDFSRKYALKPDWRPTSFSLSTDERPGKFNVHRGYIDWARVRERWDGLLVTPYSWQMRMHQDTMWYYGWDCASACIWNLSVLEQGETEPVPEEERTHTPYVYEEPAAEEPEPEPAPERIEVPIIPGGYTMTSLPASPDEGDYLHNSLEDRP